MQHILIFLFLSGFSFMNIHESQTAREVGGHFFNPSLTPATASQTLKHQPMDYCREIISADSQQPNSNREPLASERKLLTIKLPTISKDLAKITISGKILKYGLMKLLEILNMINIKEHEKV